MSPPKSVPDSAFKMFSLLDALVAVLEMCVWKVSGRSKVMPRNFASSTIGISCPLMDRGVGRCGLWLLKRMHLVFSGDLCRLSGCSAW